MPLRPNEISAEDYVKLTLKQVSHVPAHIDTVVGDIKIQNNKNIQFLPEGIKVIEGSLELWSCVSITHLPEDLSTINGDLNLWSCESLTHLPEILSTLNGYLNLVGCTSITHLPKGLTTIYGYLDLKKTKIRRIPNNIKAKKVYCDKAFIDSIPFEQLPLYIGFNFYDDRKEYPLKDYLAQRLKQGEHYETQ